jgi:pimeloyl-ACP methyl ester carboxylesterase
MHIDTPGARIWAHQQGEGDAVLLIGGLGDPAEAWQAQIDAFAGRYRVIASDNRGAGLSRLRRGWSPPYGWRAWAK